MKTQPVRKLLATYEKLIDQLERLARNPRTSPRVLEKLASLTDSQVTASVMLNSNTPSHILEKELRLRSGVGGADEETRFHICYNPALRLTVLKKLIASDPSPHVREAGQRALAMRQKKM